MVAGVLDMTVAVAVAVERRLRSGRAFSWWHRSKQACPKAGGQNPNPTQCKLSPPPSNNPPSILRPDHQSPRIVKSCPPRLLLKQLRLAAQIQNVRDHAKTDGSHPLSPDLPLYRVSTLVCITNPEQLSKEEEAAGEEVEVRREDQDKINKFSRLSSREQVLEDELKAKAVRARHPSPRPGSILPPCSVVPQLTPPCLRYRKKRKRSMM